MLSLPWEAICYATILEKTVLEQMLSVSVLERGLEQLKTYGKFSPRKYEFSWVKEKAEWSLIKGA